MGILTKMPGREGESFDADKIDFFRHSRANSTMQTFIKNRRKRINKSTNNQTVILNKTHSLM